MRQTWTHGRMVAKMTQAEAARALGVTRQAVQICERKALRKLREGLLACPEVREWLESRGIKAYAEVAEGRRGRRGKALGTRD